jgi:hypothetical protein
MTLKVDFSWCLVPLVKAWFFRIPLSFPCLLLSLCLLDFLVGAFKPWREFFCWGSLNWALRVYKVQFCQDSASFVGFLLSGFCGVESGGRFQSFHLVQLKNPSLGFEGVLCFSGADWVWVLLVGLSKEKGMFFCFWISALLGFDICYFWRGWFVLCLSRCELFRVILSLNVEFLGLVLKFWVLFEALNGFFSLCGYIEKLSIWFAETVGDWGWSTRKIASVCASL